MDYENNEVNYLDMEFLHDTKPVELLLWNSFLQRDKI